MAQQPDQLDVNTVLQELMRVQHEWRKIGKNLGLDKSTITEIEKEKLDQQDSLKKVLEAEPLTWTKVVMALYNIDKDLAKTIAEYYEGTV